MISASYSSPRWLSMNCAVFHSISSRSAASARRSASELSDAMSSSSTRRYGPSVATRFFAARTRVRIRHAHRRYRRIFERPFQRAMNDQVRVAANGRGEMRVLLRGEREMAEQIGGIARLLERTQHQVGKDSLLGLAGNLFGESLIVLRANVHFVAPREA